MTGMRRRGLRDVRNSAARLGRRDAAKERPLLQFQLGCLELERSRLLSERQAATRRLAEIDERCAAIDQMMAQYSAALDRPAGAAPAPAEAPGGAGPAPGRTLRY